MSDFSDSLINDDDGLYINKKIKPAPKPEPSINAELKDNIIDVFSEAEVSTIDASKIDSFTQVSRSRNTIYNTIDTMADDPTLASILETYAEDATEMNDEGNVVWCECSDEKILAYINYLLDTMQINKNIYNWVYSLCKYGDLYVRMFRESDYKDPIFSIKNNTKDKELNEDIKINVYSKSDKLTHYVEMVKNPADIFELTRFGKTQGFIKATAPDSMSQQRDGFNTPTFIYDFHKQDVEIYGPTEFVHASLDNSSSRMNEEVKLFYDDNENKSLTYNVKKGQSLFYNVFKIWRQLSLLEYSILLNRYTKSSITRVVNVEVGDMDKSQVKIELRRLKNLIEQKTALDTNKGMGEYTNPGPMENTIYVPTYGGQGTITTTQLGGDVDVKSLADLEYFRNKFFGAMRVPKQFFGETEDGAGFNGGESLAIISSRYAKMVKRIQNTIIQMITDMINIMLIDKNMDAYINKFTIKMLPPTTREELDRQEKMSSEVQIARDIMDLIGDIDSSDTKLKILKNLLSTFVNDNEILQLIQNEIEELEKEGPQSEDDNEDAFDSNTGLDVEERRASPDIGIGEDEVEIEEPQNIEDSDIDLPTPASVGIDDEGNDNT